MAYALTWNNVLRLVRKAGPDGLTNEQISGLLDRQGKYDRRVPYLTLIMYEAGEIKRRNSDGGMTRWRYYTQERAQ